MAQLLGCWNQRLKKGLLTRQRKKNKTQCCNSPWGVFLWCRGLVIPFIGALIAHLLCSLDISSFRLRPVFVSVFCFSPIFPPWGFKMAPSTARETRTTPFCFGGCSSVSSLKRPSGRAAESLSSSSFHAHSATASPSSTFPHSLSQNYINCWWQRESSATFAVLCKTLWALFSLSTSTKFNVNYWEVELIYSALHKSRLL